MMKGAPGTLLNKSPILRVRYPDKYSAKKIMNPLGKHSDRFFYPSVSVLGPGTIQYQVQEFIISF